MKDFEINYKDEIIKYNIIKKDMIEKTIAISIETSDLNNVTELWTLVDKKLAEEKIKK